jgi:hypothetical protein
MDAITARRIGNAALALAIITILWAIGSKFGLLPRLTRLRDMALIALVFTLVARAFRRRAERVQTVAGD